ncbi:MAG: hypothetical protein OEM31_06110, partial [Gammaproteobacteria bacterium]|nr:hypothetical protein [Gammaproteobacteria bacterium]
MNGPFNFIPASLVSPVSWPRWWLWAAVGITVSLSWTVPFVPWWAALGSWMCGVLTLTILAFFARKESENISLESKETLEGEETKNVLEQVDALMAHSKDIEQMPQVDEVLQNMAADNQRR